MNYNCWDLRNLQEQVKKAFCYQKLLWPFTVWINCSSDLKIFENSWPSTSNFNSFSRSLEQFFITVGQDNFGNKIPLKLGLNWNLLDLNVFSVPYFISSNENESKSILFCLCFLLKLLFNKQKLRRMGKTLKVGILTHFSFRWRFILFKLYKRINYAVFFSLYFSTFLGWMVERTFWCHTEFRMIIDEKFLIHAYTLEIA